jgi:predicted dienelactone hydrolase
VKFDNERKKWGLAPFFLCALASAACGHDTLYKFDPGPLEVKVIDELTFHDAVQVRDVRIRVLYPDGVGPYPVVVYSTGMFCFPQMYDLVTRHWVSHGYIVLQPNHLDSPNNVRPPTMEELEVVLPSRARDVSFVLDSLEDIGERANIEARIDDQRLAVAGHSFGAGITMIKTGLYLKEEFKGPYGETYDERFQAAVVMSGMGHGMEQFADNAFDGIRRPLMATGGSRDIGRVDPGGLTATEWRMQPFLLAPPGDKYSVITEGTDHYMGGLICSEKKGDNPDPEAAAIVRAMTTAFLDAYLKNDAAAQGFLKSVDVPTLTDGKARYQYR